MKPIRLLAATLFTACLPAHGQLILNAGDVFTYDMALAPFVLTDTRLFVPAIGAPPPVVGFTFSSVPASVDPGDLLEYQLIVSGQPLPISSTASGSGSGFATLQSRASTMIQFMMRSGSVTLDHLSLSAVENTFIPPDSVRQMSFSAEVTPVPEPGTMTLLALAGLAGIWWKLRMRPEGRATDRSLPDDQDQPGLRPA